ncbi:scoloptoxin SSD14-like [Ixodes scapularis]
MILTRLTYVLEEARDDPYYDTAQTGFRPGLCTHDSLHLLRNFVGKRRRGTNKVPGLLVAVDLRKAFDTVEHSAVIEELEESGAGTRIINFVKSFLKNRTFEISSGAQQPRMFQNFRGVPQGAILSPTLFNLVMRKIARVLRAIPHLQHTTYADDITLWLLRARFWVRRLNANRCRRKSDVLWPCTARRDCRPQEHGFVFERNGSVADAAIATLLCACVVLPHSVGLGGGFIALIYDKKSNATHVLDAREVAPMAASPDMFIQNTEEALVGGRAVAVPGVVHGLGELHRRFGRLPWAELFTPAVNLARYGFPVGPDLSAALAAARIMFQTNLPIKNVFWNNSSNTPFREGDMMKQPLLAETLELISNTSASAFYRGNLARKLVGDMKRMGGIISGHDLHSYFSKWREPSEAWLPDGSRLLSSPAPSSGPILLYVVAMLSQMKAPGSEALLYHRLVEMYKYAYAKLNELADEDFANVTVVEQGHRLDTGATSAFGWASCPIDAQKDARHRTRVQLLEPLKQRQKCVVTALIEFVHLLSSAKRAMSPETFCGIISGHDLHSYFSKWREPSEAWLPDGSRLLSSPAPSSGPILLYVVAMLSQMKAPGSEALLYHRLVEMYKYAYAKLNELADEDFANVTVHVHDLLSAEHVRKTLGLIDDERTYDDPRHYGLHRLGGTQHGSSHFSFLSPTGDAVSLTSSLGESFGARCIASSLGVILNNHMSEFTLPRPQPLVLGYTPNENNYISPGKRPVTTMAPSLLLDRRGDAVLVIGASGGARIVSSASFVMHNILWRDMSLRDAVEAPRLHHQLLPNDVVYEHKFSEDVLEELRRKGHVLKAIDRRPASVNAIAKSQDRVIYAAADFRKGGIVDGL